MDHSFSIHLERLEKLCRICGERCVKDQTHKPLKSERSILCEKYTKDILLYFRINITNDSDGAHSKSMCVRCYRRMLNYKKRGVSDLTLDRTAQLTQKSNDIWTHYNSEISAHECQSCALFLKQTKGCVQIKIPSTPETFSTNSAVDTQDRTNTPTDTTVLAVTQTETNAQIDTPADDEITSSLSSHITDTDVNNPETQTSPIHLHDHTHTEGDACIVIDDLPIRPVTCTPSCSVSSSLVGSQNNFKTIKSILERPIMPLSNAQEVTNPTMKSILERPNVLTASKHRPEFFPCSTSTSDQKTYEATLLSILEKPVTEAPSPLLEKVGTHIARMKTNNSSEKDILRFKTKGQQRKQ